MAALLVPQLLSASSVWGRTVGGLVRDARSGEAVVGAVVSASGRRHAVTDAEGHFSLSLSPTDTILSFSCLGYEQVCASVDTDRFTSQGSPISVRMQPAAYDLTESMVRASGGTMATLSHVSITPLALKQSVSPLGERDVMKLMQTFPGVRGSAEGKSSLSVRGGAPGQNLVLLDGVPVYKPEHVFGFFSVFNADAVKSADLYKGAFPARYAGRLSSVIDVTTKEGDKSTLHGSASLGLVSARAHLEAPLVRDKLSLGVYGRRSWVDWLSGAMAEGVGLKATSKLSFWDINAKVHARPDSTQSASLMAYVGRDGYRDSADGQEGVGMRWGNTLVSAHYAKQFSSGVSLDGTLSYSGCRSKVLSSSAGDSLRAGGSYACLSRIGEYSLSLEARTASHGAHSLSMGMQVAMREFSPQITRKDTLGMSRQWEETVRGAVAALYAEDVFRPTQALRLVAGMRLGLFAVGGKVFFQPEPRLSGIWEIGHGFRVGASWARMYQNDHLLTGNSLFYTTEMWVCATPRVRPMRADQWTLDWAWVHPKVCDVFVSFYAKRLVHLVDFVDGATFSGLSAGWEDMVASGEGRALGLECALRRDFGPVSASVSYALSKADQRMDGVDYGRWYPSRQDRRHAVDIAGLWRISRKFSFSAHWVFQSGNRMSLPLMHFVQADIPDWIGTFVDVKSMDGRNNYVLPPHHRLDLALMFTHGTARRHGELSLSLYNAYNRQNIFNVKLFTRMEQKTPSSPSTVRYVLYPSFLLPILPSLSYTYCF